MKQNGRTLEGEAFTHLLLECMRFHGVLERHGTKIAAAFGQTPARWQVLGAISAASLTASQIARRMGLSRQSVQRVANELVKEELVQLMENPDHVRSPLLEMTEEGRAVFDQMTGLQKKWSNRVGRGLDPLALEKTRAGVEAVRRRLEETRLADSFFVAEPKVD